MSMFKMEVKGLKEGRTTSACQCSWQMASFQRGEVCESIGDVVKGEGGIQHLPPIFTHMQTL